MKTNVNKKGCSIILFTTVSTYQKLLNLINFEQIFIITECSWQDTTLFVELRRIFGNCPITGTPCYQPVEVAPCPMWIQRGPKGGHGHLEVPPILHPPPYRGKKLKWKKRKNTCILWDNTVLNYKILLIISIVIFLPAMWLSVNFSFSLIEEIIKTHLLQNLLLYET